ncbi:MAG: hypothetical protein NUW11_10685 [Candidatus Saccharicenans sp.]|nr:hypothetical protein [Candidatus Saccharicenans sp.]
MIKTLTRHPIIRYARMGLCLIIVSVSLLISYGGFLGYSILPADVVFSWASVATKLLLLTGMTFSQLIKGNIYSKISWTFFVASLAVLGLIYYAIVININTKQARRGKAKFPVNVFLIHFAGVGLSLLAPMGIDNFSATMAIIGAVVVSSYLFLDFLLAKKEAQKNLTVLAEDLNNWLK